MSPLEKIDNMINKSEKTVHGFGELQLTDKDTF
jgi:hypothetical protein